MLRQGIIPAERPSSAAIMGTHDGCRWCRVAQSMICLLVSPQIFGKQEGLAAFMKIAVMCTVFLGSVVALVSPIVWHDVSFDLHGTTSQKVKQTSSLLLGSTCHTSHTVRY